MAATIDSDGFQYFVGAFGSDEIADIGQILDAIPSNAAGRRWAGDNLAELLVLPAMTAVKHKLADVFPGFHALRVVAFRKDEAANWFVPAHQDRSIPIPTQNPPEGFTRPTHKQDGWQAEAPLGVLQSMRNFRIFVDDATEADGPLEVIAGSHLLGRIEQAAIPGIVAQTEWWPLTGKAGDMVVLSPMLLHRSIKAKQPRGRRVLQIECLPTAAVKAFNT